MKNKLFTSAIIVLVFSGLLLSVSCKPLFDSNLSAIASEVNKTCPVMVDKITRLDNAIALPEKIFHYNYSLVGVDKSEVDTGLFRKNLIPAAINTIRTNPALKYFRDNEVSLEYEYKDKNGTFIYKYIITPAEYK